MGRVPRGPDRGGVGARCRPDGAVEGGGAQRARQSLEEPVVRCGERQGGGCADRHGVFRRKEEASGVGAERSEEAGAKAGRGRQRRARAQ
jgi:hypothetical protein